MQLDSQISSEREGDCWNHRLSHHGVPWLLLTPLHQRSVAVIWSELRRCFARFEAARVKNRKPGYTRSTLLVTSALIRFASIGNEASWSCLCPTCFNPRANFKKMNWYFCTYMHIYCSSWTTSRYEGSFQQRLTINKLHLHHEATRWKLHSSDSFSAPVRRGQARPNSSASYFLLIIRLEVSHSLLEAARWRSGAQQIQLWMFGLQTQPIVSLHADKLHFYCISKVSCTGRCILEWCCQSLLSCWR